LKEFDVENATFTPGTCGYLCPTKSVIKVKPRFIEYKVLWPNRAAGLGISGSFIVSQVFYTINFSLKCVFTLSRVSAD
jgi:hypothetical protein